MRFEPSFGSALNYGTGCFIGTSITLGVRAGVLATQVVSALVGPTRPLVAINAGIGGNTSVDLLNRFETDCLAYHPGMISIEAGTNDPGASVVVGAIGTAGSYTDNMSKMIVKAQRTGARVTIWVSILAQNSALDTSIAPYRTAVRTLASTYSCDLFDTYADMAALSAGTQNSYFNEAAGSGQHLSVAGNAWAAGLVGSGAYLNSFKSA